jgi:hypothetical protein
MNPNLPHWRRPTPKEFPKADAYQCWNENDPEICSTDSTPTGALRGFFERHAEDALTLTEEVIREHCPVIVSAHLRPSGTEAGRVALTAEDVLELFGRPVL